MQHFEEKIKRKFDRELAPLRTTKRHMAARHKQARDNLNAQHEKRHDHESRLRQERYATGLKRLWSHVTGQFRKIERRNELEALECYQRDRTEKDNLILHQLDEQQDIQNRLESTSPRLQKELMDTRKAVFSKRIDHIKVPEKTQPQPQQEQSYDLGM